MSYAEYKEWLILYKELLVIVKNKEKQYRLNPTDDLKQEIKGYLFEQQEYVRLLQSYNSITLNNELFKELTDKDKVSYLNNLLSNLKKVNGKKDIITINGNKISIAHKIKGRFINYSNLLNKLTNKSNEMNNEVVTSSTIYPCKTDIVFKSNNKIKNIFDLKTAIKCGAACATLAFCTIFSYVTLGNDSIETNNYQCEVNDDFDNIVSSNLDMDMFNNVSIDDESVTIDDTTINNTEAASILLNTPENEDVIVSSSNEDTTMYYNINCPKEWQDYIFELADKWNIPAEIGFTICERESNGSWSTNGVISATNDYGVAQINKCNLDFVNQELGYSTNDVLNDPYKNLDSMFMIISYIFDTLGYDSNNYDLENVYGTYNGWLNWKNYSGSRAYAEGCMEIMDETINPSNMTLTLSK